MDVNKHIVFRSSDCYELYNYLIINGLVKESTDPLVVLDILESNSHWQKVEKYVKKYNIFMLSNTLFSKEELFSAEWLTVRSKWYNGYPQPEGTFTYGGGIPYSGETRCAKCGVGIKQVDSFRILKQPKWGSKYFFMLNWIFDELFVSDIGRVILENSDISGVSFRKVKDKKGEKIIENVWQMEIPFVLPNGLVPQTPTIADIYCCEECGSTKYRSSGIGMLTYKKEVFEGAPDFVKSAEMWGEGKAAPKIIITSQKAHRFLKEQKMDKNLVFEPIELV